MNKFFSLIMLENDYTNNTNNNKNMNNVITIIRAIIILTCIWMKEYESDPTILTTIRYNK